MKSKIISLFFLSTQSIYSAEPFLNGAIGILFTIAGYFILSVIVIGTISIILSIFDELPKIIISIIIFLLSSIVMIFLFILAGYLGYFIIYKVFWLHTNGFYRLGGAIFGFYIWKLFISLTLEKIPLGNFLNSTLYNFDYIENVDSISSLFIKWKDSWK